MTNTIRSEGYRALVEALIEAREASGLSQRALAHKLGCPPSTIASIELGSRRLDVVELVVLSRAVDASAAELFSVVVAKTPPDHSFVNPARSAAKKLRT